MNIPEFTAQASLYRSSNSYRSLAFDRASPQGTVLVPQVKGPDAPNPGDCFSDCMDKLAYHHPELTREQAGRRCGQACRDPVGTPTDRGYGPSCESSPPESCAIALGACCVFLPFPFFSCPAICWEYYAICLENSRRECLIARHGPLTGGSSYPLVVTEEFPSAIPFGNPPPPPPPDNFCIPLGRAPCGPLCCPKGLQCCSYSDQYGADCRVSCVH
jgi:hypothetical protein